MGSCMTPWSNENDLTCHICQTNDNFRTAVPPEQLCGLMIHDSHRGRSNAKVAVSSSVTAAGYTGCSRCPVSNRSSQNSYRVSREANFLDS